MHKKSFLKIFLENMKNAKKYKNLDSQQTTANGVFYNSKIDNENYLKNDLDNSKLPQKVDTKLNTENKNLPLRTKAEHSEQKLNTENFSIL